MVIYRRVMFNCLVKLMDKELSNNGYSDHYEKMVMIKRSAGVSIDRFFNDNKLKNKVINKWENNEALILEVKEHYIEAYEAFKKHAPYWIPSLCYLDWQKLDAEEKTPFKDWGEYIKPLRDCELLFNIVMVGGSFSSFVLFLLIPFFLP
ncbi:hypothetical protein ACOWKY_06685 [Helicobacter pylori]